MGNCLSSDCSCCSCCCKDAPTDQSGHKTSPNHRLQGPDPPKFMDGPPSPTTAVRDSMKGKGGGLQEQEEGEERGVRQRKQEDLCAPPLPANLPHQSPPTLEQPRGGVSHKKEESLHASSLPAKKPQRSVPPPLEQPRESVLRKKEDDLDDSIPAKILHQSLPPPLEQPTRGVLHKKEEDLHASSPLAKMPYRPLSSSNGTSARKDVRRDLACSSSSCNAS